MRNLTNTEATDLTGLHVQLVDPATGEQHKTFPADGLGDTLWTNGAGTLTNVDQTQPLQALVEDAGAGAVAAMQLTTDQGGVATLYGSDKVVLQTGGELEMVGLPEDVDLSGTKVLVYNPGDYKVEYRDFPAGGATVVVTMNPPSADGDVEGAIWLVTDDGTPSGTVLEQYIWDLESASWIEMNRNAKSLLKFGTTAPTSQGDWDGEEFFVTSDGTSAGDVLEQWIWDEQSSTWVERPAGTTVLNTTSTSAPSLTDPSLNTAFKNQYVTVGSDQYFVDATGKAVKVAGSAAEADTTPGQAIAIGTQAALNALTDKVTGGYYIVTDGPNQGDILQWTDTDGDGTGDVWTVAVVPTQGLEWTVLTNVAGNPAGQYTYSLTTDTWTKTADVEPVIPPVDDLTAIGGIKFVSQRGSFQNNNGPMFILYDSVAGFGVSNSSATDDGTNGTIAGGVRPETIRKATYTQYQQASPFTQLINYRPYMVDVHQNTGGAVALDNKGVVYFKGGGTFMTAFANAQSGLSNVAAPSYTPDKFWADRTIKATKIFLSEGANHVLVLAGDGTLWSKGAGGSNGLFGDGTTATDTLWHQVNVPQKAYKKFGVVDATHAFALADDGDLYLWGNNSSNRILNGSTGVINTPTRPTTLPAIKDIAADGTSVMAISTTGARWYIGTNSNGKFGDGTTTSKTVWTDGTAFSAGFTFDKVFADARPIATSNAGYAYITTDGKAVYTGYQNLNRGIAGATATTNVTTPTLMGSGAYQGVVVDIRTFSNSSLIHTNQGEVWTCVNSNGSAYGEHGWGVNSATGNNIGINIFRKVPVPSAVANIYSVSNGATEFATANTVLTTEGRIYNWGGIQGDIQNSSLYRRAPYEVPHNQFRQGDPKALEQIDLMRVTGSIASASPLTITSITDGGSNQTVTATFVATGTAGKVNLTGSTASGPDTTFLTWLTNTVYMNSTTSTLTVKFTINAADIPTLNPPNSQAQSWTLNLVVNGA